MKAILLRSIIAAGAPRKVNDVVEMSQAEYDFLVTRNLVKPYEEKVDDKKIDKKADNKKSAK
ncbi:hypothetical protein L3V83_14310 [Thiotrichales bacterium 19X7-9]|nr:hypothetical protein [Thiotrichales bacterium 19X7-9]